MNRFNIYIHFKGLVIPRHNWIDGGNVADVKRFVQGVIANGYTEQHKTEDNLCNFTVYPAHLISKIEVKEESISAEDLVKASVPQGEVLFQNVIRNFADIAAKEYLSKTIS